MVSLDISVRHTASVAAREFDDLADRLGDVPGKAMPEAVEVLRASVESTIESIAGGVYWDINTDVRSTGQSVIGEVITPKSKRHPITPNSPNEFIHFFWEAKGRWVRIKEIDHPGSRPVDWPPGVRQTAPHAIEEVFVSRTREAVRGINSANPAAPVRGL